MVGGIGNESSVLLLVFGASISVGAVGGSGKDGGVGKDDVVGMVIDDDEDDDIGTAWPSSAAKEFKMMVKS